MCKKCARKIVNWLRFFNGLQQVFTARFLLEKYRRKFQPHNRLPTLTASKGQLEYSMLQPRPSWKRTLFGKNPVVQYTVVNEEISHLMKIPTKFFFLTPVVKVRSKVWVQYDQNDKKKYWPYRFKRNPWKEVKRLFLLIVDFVSVCERKTLPIK